MKLRTLVLIVGATLTCTAFAGGEKNDQSFVTKAAQGGMAEVAMGKIAVSNGEDPAVRTFAQTMVDDHSKANDELKEAAGKASATVPPEPNAKQKATAAELGKMHGAAFDKKYHSIMVKDHEEDVALFKKEAKSGHNSDMKAFAEKTLPTLEHHLKMAKEMSASKANVAHK